MQRSDLVAFLTHHNRVRKEKVEAMVLSTRGDISQLLDGDVSSTLRDMEEVVTAVVIEEDLSAKLKRQQQYAAEQQEVRDSCSLSR